MNSRASRTPPDRAPRHGEPDTPRSQGIRRGPTLAVLRSLSRRRTTSWLGVIVEGLLVDVGDGEPAPSDVIRAAAVIGTAVWALIALAIAGLAILLHRWTPPLVGTCLWAGSVSALGCVVVWACRGAWWNLRLAKAKGAPISVRATGVTEWLALAVGLGWGLYWARPR